MTTITVIYIGYAYSLFVGWLSNICSETSQDTFWALSCSLRINNYSLIPLQGNKGMNCSFKQTINIFVTIIRLTVEPRKKSASSFSQKQIHSITARRVFSVPSVSGKKQKSSTVGEKLISSKGISCTEHPLLVLNHISSSSCICSNLLFKWVCKSSLPPHHLFFLPNNSS